MNSQSSSNPVRTITAWVSVSLLFVLSGCVSPASNTLPAYDPALITGAVIFGEPVHSDEFPVPDMLGVDSQMREFVEELITDKRLSVVRFRYLLHALALQGYFDGSYSADVTQTAKDTFHSKRGNCLSYTSMFVVLARTADLRASFQIVDVPPSWDADGKYLIRNNHINAVVSGQRFNKHHADTFTVDFNDIRADSGYRRRVVSDEYALSLFQANLGVQRLLEGNEREGFAYLRASIETYPNNADHWINLGAYYATKGAYEQAQQAYALALHLDPRSKTANSGIARAYSQLGLPELSETYNAKAKHYQENNPYYHFGLSRMAYERSQFQNSLTFINKALRLKRRIGRFHFMKGLVQTKLGDAAGAKKSFQTARRLGQYKDLQRRYGLNLISQNY